MTKLNVKSDTATRKVKIKRSNEVHYTLGEVFRLGLLKNWDGNPYKDKATVSRVIRLHGGWIEADTRFGKAKVVSDAVIAEINALKGL